MEWHGIRDLLVEGRGWEDTESYYDRLPARARDMVRAEVWALSQCSAGMCTRFVTDASAIHGRWLLRSEQLAMPHMPATGVSGLDLYVRQGPAWRWLAVGQPTQQDNQVALVTDLTHADREYLLYLPLYNGVSSVHVGIPEGAHIKPAAACPAERRRPIVFYGTSITQGGCASRPGMAHTAILGRRLQRPVINLGFSGQGTMDPEIADLLAELDAAVYVLDCLPNMEPDAVRQRVLHTVRRLRQSRPLTPILLVEDRTYADAFARQERKQRNEASRAALREAHAHLVADGVGALYTLRGGALLGDDGEDTVDGSHPTDLGFMRQASGLEPILAGILRER